MTTFRNLSETKITLSELYQQQKQIRVHLSDKDFKFSVILVGRDDLADCKISSFRANLWFRTQNGENRKQYKSVVSLQKAITNIVKKYVDFNGAITFSISEEIDIL